MSEGVTIRPAVRGDHEALCALLAEVDATHWEALPDVFRTVEGPARPATWLDELLGDPERALLVAEEGGQLLGAVEVIDRAAPDAPLFAPRRYAVVDQLVVRADRQRAGVGRALMDAAHAWARDRGLTQVELQVYEFNAGARAFYEALGYETRSRKLGRRLDGS